MCNKQARGGTVAVVAVLWRSCTPKMEPKSCKLKPCQALYCKEGPSHSKQGSRQRQGGHLEEDALYATSQNVVAYQLPAGCIAPAAGRIAPAAGRIAPAAGRIAPAAGRIAQAAGRIVQAAGQPALWRPGGLAANLEPIIIIKGKSFRSIIRRQRGEDTFWCTLGGLLCHRMMGCQGLPEHWQALRTAKDAAGTSTHRSEPN